MKHFACVDEILISNGDPEHSVSYTDDKVKIFNDCSLNSIYSLDLRFICGLRAKNDLIIIDDDIYIEESELNKLVLEYTSNPNRIIGIFGRNISAGYQYRDVHDNVDIVLTKILICQRKLCSLFFACKPLIERIYIKGEPYGNGEDIVFSFIASIYYKRKHTCLRIPIKELAQHHAISHKKNHLPYRKELSAYLLSNYTLFEQFIKDIKLE
jgi:hypothetical protein